MSNKKGPIGPKNKSLCVVFISEPHEGRIYIAERSRKGSTKLLWSVMPVEPVAADVRIEARKVPRQIRNRAYKLFEGDRIRQLREVAIIYGNKRIRDYGSKNSNGAGIV